MKNYRQWRLVAILFAGATTMAVLLGFLLPLLTKPLTRDAVGHDLLRDGKPQLAASVFEDPVYRAIALYRAGQYQRASARFFEAGDIESIYNMASALAHYGRYDQAIKALQSVISRQPNHEDALHNIEIVRAAARLARQQRDPTRDGLKARPSEEQGDEPLQSLAALSSNEDIQTVSDDPGAMGDDAAAKADTGNASSGRSLPGSTSDVSTNAMAPAALPPAGVFASGATHGQHDKLDDYTLSGGKNRSGQNAPDPEQAMAGDITLRHIIDDPAIVLRARLQAAWTRRNEQSP